MQDQLVFVVGPPRSGSTLLARMLGAHSAIHSPAEPHLLTPLAHLGFYEMVDKAPYDPVITQRAIRALVDDLPEGEADYLEALRAYCDALYEKLLSGSGRQLLLDKTPAYSLVLDFAARLYPKARYIVLTRHPLAVWSSAVQSFFDGDHRVAHAHNPLLERYVPAIARFLREAPVPHLHVRYEQLVADPDRECARICEHLGIEFEPGMVDYGEQEGGRTETARGLGDPMSVAQNTRPTTESLDRWAGDLEGEADKVAQCEEILARLTDPDLETWGYPRAPILEALSKVDTGAERRRRRPLTRHTLERKLLVALRRNIHENAFGRVVRQVRGICDVLLR